MAMKDITDLQVVQAQQRWQENQEGQWAYEILATETGQPEKVCYRCMERAAERGLLEYGVSLRTAWLTEKGKALLGIPRHDETRIRVGDEVKFWMRRKGERAILVSARILALSENGSLARVQRLDGCAIPVQTMETKRFLPKKADQ